GEVFALLMSIYPITRFLIEGLRNDEAAIYGTGLSISQNVSIVLLLCAAALWFYILRQPRLGARDAGQGIASPFIEREESNVQ
ncbi:MAG: prolipoprotein diacylglyceryl transferase, partial [bacterium]|nr:prolipoprotein diacylglyceryl transferase [bacterium]